MEVGDGVVDGDLGQGCGGVFGAGGVGGGAFEAVSTSVSLRLGSELVAARCVSSLSSTFLPWLCAQDCLILRLVKRRFYTPSG